MRRILRALFDIVSTLDLHGAGVQAAHEETLRFLRKAAGRGEARVRIVYGKGHGSPGGVGVLRQVIPYMLEHEAGPWVVRYERRLDSSGDDGSVVVWLRRAAEP